MKKFVALLVASCIFASAFACTYDEESHKLTECDAYKNSESVSDAISESCSLAHKEYNKYVAGKVGTKIKNGASRIGNSLTKAIGDALDDDSDSAEVDER